MKKKFAVFVLTIFLCTINFSCTTNSALVPKDLLTGYYNVAEEYYSLKKYDKAAEYYEKCLAEKNPEMHRTVQYQLAKTYFQLERYKDSQKIYEDLLKFDGDNTNIKIYLGYCLIKQAEFDKAEEIYKDLIISQVNNQAVYKNLILLYVIKEDFESADKLIAKYKEMFPLEETIQDIEKELATAKSEKATKLEAETEDAKDENAKGDKSTPKQK